MLTIVELHSSPGSYQIWLHEEHVAIPCDEVDLYGTTVAYLRMGWRLAKAPQALRNQLTESGVL